MMRQKSCSVFVMNLASSDTGSDILSSDIKDKTCSCFLSVNPKSVGVLFCLNGYVNQILLM